MTVTSMKQDKSIKLIVDILKTLVMNLPHGIYMMKEVWINQVPRTNKHQILPRSNTKLCLLEKWIMISKAIKYIT